MSDDPAGDATNVEFADLRDIDLVDLPLALADLHHAIDVGHHVEVAVPADPDPGAPFPATVARAAGFTVVAEADNALTLVAERALPDHVGPGMRLLCCGLNPSLHAADAGVGYVTASNRFWRAMAAAGLATADRDPRHLLVQDRIGMTDLVKRPTTRADELAAAEYREGVGRLDRLCAWLQPSAVAVVGLAGWRAGVDRKAAVGWQPVRLGEAPVYVMPSTSGLNAGTSLEDLTDHLVAAVAGPPPGTGAET